ncbi:exosortase/archaeosortase family protein [Thiomicrorhabdus sp.]|uniref:exosortase/archaeosortase family protein n=1 Tax=Thiomicrorhabdus sp. TaxID=2039724 RepID=UPI0029C96CA5|nr:exosortase/archaeosortase family protein [Thiomicrorhabdus sp.]
MLRFSIAYFVWVGVLFTLFFFESFSPLFVINQWQTEVTNLITRGWVHAFDLPILLQANTLILENGMHLHIVHECNGLVPYLLYLAAILAYPTPFRVKLNWVLLGYAAVMVINTIRMLLITLVVLEDKSLFPLAHDWFGRYGVAILTLSLFFWFTSRAPIVEKEPVSS